MLDINSLNNGENEAGTSRKGFRPQTVNWALGHIFCTEVIRLLPLFVMLRFLFFFYMGRYFPRI